jgi:hypothetical protein
LRAGPQLKPGGVRRYISTILAMVEVVVNLHMHTIFSDGHGTHDAIAAAAAQAGLQAIVTTDHNVRVGGMDGYRHGVLMLAGEEVHDYARRPQANHCLIYGAAAELSQFARSPQGLIDAVNAHGGMAYLAHPIEYPARLGIENGAYGWHDWDIRGYVGIELWNYMSEFKSLLRNWPTAFVYGFAPSLGVRGPFPATLRLWDDLLASGQRVNAIGGSDAHAVPFQIGLAMREIFPYAYLFRCVNTHLLLTTALNGDVAHDSRLILDTLRVGRGFIGYGLPGDPRGFSFTANAGDHTATMGQEIRMTGDITLTARVPLTADIRLIRHGAVVARARGQSLTCQARERGAYRIEVRRRFRGASRGWIFSNPIYVV